MKFSLSSLQEIFCTSLDPNELEDQLTTIGLEVDAIEEHSPAFEGVYACKVLEVNPHPDADRLVVAKVDTGHETLQIVCGAKNCRPNLLTALATVGAKIKDKEGKTHQIKKGNLRGVDSFGMLVSKEELGFEEKSDGIIELDTSFSLGEDLATVFQDTLLEISFTPNLGHAMSLLGIARELSCLLKKPFQMPLSHLSYPSLDTSSKDVQIESKKKCPSFDGLIIRELKVGPSPLWLQQKLKSLGLQSINNVVDATNYVLHELGHPLHAYDLDKLSLDTLCVKSFDSIYSFEALDGKTYEVPPNSLFVCDQDGPLSLAGVIGGKASEVSLDTTSILLEAAVFEATSIRKTSRKLGLSTEASKHFERGVDPRAPQKTLARAASMILSIAGGILEPTPVHTGDLAPTQRQIKVRTSFICKHLGVSISKQEIFEIFQRLDFEPKELKSDFELTIPSYRNDLYSEIDFVEEVARFYGFDRIELKTPKMISSPQNDSPLYLFENRVHTSALREGLQEVLTCDLISPIQSKFQNTKGPILQALNSVSIDQSILRNSLLANHLQVVKNNLNQNSKDLYFYEIGKTYSQEDEKFTEESKLAITLTGYLNPPYFSKEEKPVDFFQLKGIFENIFISISLKGLEVKRSEHPLFHPYRQACWRFQGKVLGYFGQLHPAKLRENQIKQNVFFGEISLPSLLAVSNPLKEVQPLCPFPSSERDWTITCLDELEIGHLLQFIQSVDSRLLKEVSLLNIFKSDKIGEGRKNVSLRFVYRNDKKTISFEAIEVEHARIVDLVLKKMKNLIVQPI